MDYWTRFIKWCQRPNMIKRHTFNPHIHMARLSRGAKAGSVSGVITGAVQSPIQNFGNNIVHKIIFRLRNLPVTPFIDTVAGIMQPWFLASIFISIIFEAIAGIFFGLIFVALFDKLPGKTPIRKGVMMSIIYWLALPVGIPMLRYIRDWGLEGLIFFLTGYFNWVASAISLIPAILWGWLLGRFWTSERLGKL